MDEKELLGSRVRQAREGLSWSQGKLAEIVGFSSAQIISAIETGQRDIKAWELFRIANGLHVPIEALLGSAPLPSTTVEGMASRSGRKLSQLRNGKGKEK